MIKSGFSYLKLTAVVAVLAIAIIGVGGLLIRTTVAREKRATTRDIGSPREQNFSNQAAVMVAADGHATTTAPTPLFNLGGVQITAINLDEGVLEDKVEVGWGFTMPQELTALGSCVVLDHFDVEIQMFREATIANDKTKSEKASALARNAVIRFSDVVGSRRVRRVNARVIAQYAFTCRSVMNQSKDF